MNQVGAIGSGNYTPAIQPRQPKENPQQDVKQEVQAQQSQAQQSSVNPDAVFDFMAASNNVNIAKNVAPTKTIKISDYVTPEQAKRIAGFVTGFENEVAKGLASVKNEFSDMSDDMALTVALASFEADNY